MKRSLIFLSGVFLFSFALSSFKDGPAFNNVDRTGSPVAGGSFCSGCHNGGSFGVSILGALKDSYGNIVTSYTPLESYTFEVQLNHTSGTPKFGFQAVALRSGNANAGDLTSAGSNVQITTLNNRKYGEQPAASTSGLFVMNWTAPAAGTGNVTFYAAGIACNGNNTTSGDQSVKMNAMVITENLIQGNDDIIAENDVLLFPNPTNSTLNIHLKNESVESLEILDLSGRQLLLMSSFSGQMAIDISSMQPGTYILRLSSTTNRILYRQFIKT